MYAKIQTVEGIHRNREACDFSRAPDELCPKGKALSPSPPATCPTRWLPHHLDAKLWSGRPPAEKRSSVRPSPALGATAPPPAFFSCPCQVTGLPRLITVPLTHKPHATCGQGLCLRGSQPRPQWLGWCRGPGQVRGRAWLGARAVGLYREQSPRQ